MDIDENTTNDEIIDNDNSNNNNNNGSDNNEIEIQQEKNGKTEKNETETEDITFNETKSDDSLLFSVTILTCDANKHTSFCHERMPVILVNDASIKAWLNPYKIHIDQCLSFAKSNDNMLLSSHAVPSEYVGNPKNKSQLCIQSMNEYDVTIPHFFFFWGFCFFVLLFVLG